MTLSFVQTGCAVDKQETAKTYVLKSNNLAGLRVTPATSYEKVINYLSRIDSAVAKSFLVGCCRLTAKKIGLKVGFYAPTSADSGMPSSCTFSFATATGKRWHAPNGLRIGTSTHTMLSLFPRANRVGKIPGRHFGVPVRAVLWELSAATGSVAQPILVAYTRNRRVVAIGIEIVGH
jgi:hypothetical protein